MKESIDLGHGAVYVFQMYINLYKKVEPHC